MNRAQGISGTSVQIEESDSKSKTLIYSNKLLQKRIYYDRTRYKWQSNWEFIKLTASTIIFSDVMEKHNVEGTDKAQTFIHDIIITLFLGMPLMYMEIILGQYTSLGTTQLVYLSPISHGLGYTLLTAVLLRSLRACYVLTDSLLYFLISFQSNLQWLLCPPKTRNKCWDPEYVNLCSGKCNFNNKEMSSIYYWRKVYMKGVVLNKTALEYETPNITRCVSLLFTWFILFVIVVNCIGSYKKIITANLYTYITLICILLMVLLLTPGSWGGLSLMYEFNLDKIFSFTVWTNSIRSMVILLGIGKALHIMQGSYLQSNYQAGTLTIAIVLFCHFIKFLLTSMTFSSIGILLQVTNTSLNIRYPQNFLFKDKIFPYVYTITPQAIGFIAAPNLWTIGYFLTIFVLVTNFQLSLIFLLEKCIVDINPVLIRYRKYIIGAICFFLSLLATLLLPNKVYILLRYIVRVITVKLELINTLFLSIVVFYVYGVQRFSDDIHFYTGSQPTKFWKICWYFSPIPLAVTLIVTLMDTSVTNKYEGFSMIDYTLLFILLLPIPILLIYELFHHLKKHYLAGMLEPHERWGPWDPEERHLRRMFNPRKEVKSRRRTDICKHNCLLGGKIFRRIVELEYIQRSDILKNKPSSYFENAKRMWKLKVE